MTSSMRRWIPSPSHWLPILALLGCCWIAPAQAQDNFGGGADLFPDFSLGGFGDETAEPVEWRASYTIDANGKAAFFTGSDRTAVFETAEVQHTQGGSTYVDTVRPVVEGADLDLEVGSRANQSDAVTFKPPTQPNSVGECEVRTDARYLRYRVTVRAPWSTAFGVEPHGRPSGSR